MTTRRRLGSPRSARRVVLCKLENKHLGTGEWISKTQGFKTWRDQEKPGLLHPLGVGGFGKSILTSVIIESLENHVLGQEHGTSQLIYNFYKADDNATQQGIEIMVHLVAQQFSNATANMHRPSVQSWEEGSKIDRLIGVRSDA